jgi:hypothetical protein
MYLQIDLRARPPVVSLEAPDDVSRFHVAVVGGADWGLVFGALVDAAAGRLEGDDAYVAVDAVRRLAAGRVEPGWDDKLAGMLEYARTKGWLDEAGNAIKAHVEWPADATG